MSGRETNIGLVGETVRDLLPTVNSGFDWEIIKKRYDSDPTGKAMSLHFTDKTGENNVEDVHLGIAEGPKIIVLDELTDDWHYLGAIVTYQDYGVRMLNPEDDMTPSRARFQHGGVSIHPAGDESRERVWMVTKNVLDIMLESVIYAANSGNEGGDE